ASDYDQNDFYQREDDKPETVKRRLDVNIAQGEPILNHYRQAGIVHDIDGNKDISEVFVVIDEVIKGLK
ncbi:adenylate kinase, partial [Streptococcus pyogenes]